MPSMPSLVSHASSARPVATCSCISTLRNMATSRPLCAASIPALSNNPSPSASIPNLPPGRLPIPMLRLPCSRPNASPSSQLFTKPILSLEAANKMSPPDNIPESQDPPVGAPLMGPKTPCMASSQTDLSQHTKSHSQKANNGPLQEAPPDQKMSPPDNILDPAAPSQH